MGTDPGADPAADLPELRRLRLRYPGTCLLCGRSLAQGAPALYEQSTRTVRCVECPTGGSDVKLAPVDHGLAGASAGREYERRKASREARVKDRFGDRLGRVILALSDEPQSTRAWAQGARGEHELAEALARVAEAQVLHDRRVPGTRGNIDHIVVAPAGVFIVDAKRYEGLIRVRNRGSFFKTDLRLYVGDRDCSGLAENMSWQVGAVERALRSAAVERMPPITPVLCFVRGEWPLLAPPDAYRGVRLEGTRSIAKLVTRERVLDEAAIEHLIRILATAFPLK